MLYFKVGTLSNPMMPDKCSYCPYETPPGETFYVIQVDPTEEYVINGETYMADSEFATACYNCYNAIRNAIRKFNIPWNDELDPSGLIPEPLTVQKQERMY